MRRRHLGLAAVAALAVTTVSLPGSAVAAAPHLESRLSIIRDPDSGPPGASATIQAGAKAYTDKATVNTFDFGDGSVETTSYFLMKHTYKKLGAYTVTLTVRDTDGNTSVNRQQITIGNDYVPIAPVRVLDTRNGTGARQAKVGPDGVLGLTVAGLHGVPPQGATAVVLNLTATGPTAASYVTAYPSGMPRPTASNLNVTAGQTVPNQVTVPIGADGKVAFYNHSGSLDLVADLEGYYVPTSSDPDAGTMAAFADSRRVLDTRNGTGAPKARVHAGGVVTFKPTEWWHTPTSQLSAVVLNITATGTTAPGFVTAYPGGSTRPVTSVLNFGPGATVAGLVTVPLGPDGTVSLYNSAGDVDLVADIQGYVPNNTYWSYGDSGYFTPTTPTRLLDTRNGIGSLSGRSGPLVPGDLVGIQVAGRAGVPSYARAVLISLTGTNTTGSGYVRVTYQGDFGTGTSNLNYQGGQTLANPTLVPIGPDGRIYLQNPLRSGSLDAIVDLQGYTTD